MFTNKKEIFLDHKNAHFSYWAKHRNSPKGVTHDFGQKNCKKLYLIFRKIRLKKECLQVLNKKETFLDYKMGSFYKAKNRNFPKGLTHDLVKNI